MTNHIDIANISEIITDELIAKQPISLHLVPDDMEQRLELITSIDSDFSEMYGNNDFVKYTMSDYISLRNTLTSRNYTSQQWEYFDGMQREYDDHLNDELDPIYDSNDEDSGYDTN